MSPTQFPCVEGSWTNLTNLISQEECYICPKGYFCLRGVSTPSGLCFTGHYCPRGMFKNSTICILVLGYFGNTLYSSLWKRVIAWERSRAGSGYGIFWGDADRNKEGGI